MITPGFISDCLAILLLLPSVPCGRPRGRAAPHPRAGRAVPGDHHGSHGRRSDAERATVWDVESWEDPNPTLRSARASNGERARRAGADARRRHRDARPRRRPRGTTRSRCSCSAATRAPRSAACTCSRAAWWTPPTTTRPSTSAVPASTTRPPRPSSASPTAAGRSGWRRCARPSRRPACCSPAPRPASYVRFDDHPDVDARFDAHRRALNAGERSFLDVLADGGPQPRAWRRALLRALDHARGRAEALRHPLLPRPRSRGPGLRPRRRRDHRQRVGAARPTRSDAIGPATSP